MHLPHLIKRPGEGESGVGIESPVSLMALEGFCAFPGVARPDKKARHSGWRRRRHSTSARGCRLFQ
jgi:hypothetical protein